MINRASTFIALKRLSTGPNEKSAAGGQEGDCNLPRSRVN
jgi:hypothetical protein